MRKYTTLDPSSDTGKQQLVSLMLGQSSPAIRQKLQKLQEPVKSDLEVLMGEAWRDYINRDKLKRRELTTAIVAALDQHQTVVENVGVDEAEAGAEIPEAEEVPTSHRLSWGQINVPIERTKNTGNASAQS